MASEQTPDDAFERAIDAIADHFRNGAACDLMEALWQNGLVVVPHGERSRQGTIVSAGRAEDEFGKPVVHLTVAVPIDTVVDLGGIVVVPHRPEPSDG